MNQNERKEMIEEYGRGFDLLRSALAEVPREAWEFKPAPGEWSVHELLIHIKDSEMMGVIRLHKLIAEPGSTITPYAEAEWSKALDYRNQDIDDSLQIFKLLRQTTYRLIKNLPDHNFTHSIIHPEWNEPYTLDKWLPIYAHHVPEHLEQLKQIYQAWKEHGK
jgi:hypothetical protein